RSSDLPRATRSNSSRHGRDPTMTNRKAKPTTPGRRGMSFADFSEITRDHPERSLVVPKPKKAGRNVHGRITTRHQGGGHKQQYRIIDFRRDKDGIPARVAHIEYDPNRSARIALLHYVDGEKSYIVCPDRVAVGGGSVIHAGCRATVGEVGNPEAELISIGKAGSSRWLGKRPSVRGVAMNPIDHPLGGGEGKASGGRNPTSPWGKTEGRTRKKGKYSDAHIVRRRGAKRGG